MKSQGKGIYQAVRRAAILALTVGMLLIFVGGTALMAGTPLSVAHAFPQGQTFSVNSSVDDANAHDSNPGDGWCLDTYERCTLRAAIEEANAYAGADTITFAQAMNIYLDTGQGALPQITEQLKIDASGVWNSGNDQPGVMLSCSSGGFSGLRLAADSSEVYGLFVTSCRDAIEITSAYNTIGGPNPGQRNVLSSNGPNGDGVSIWGSNAHHNVIQSNWIGLSVTGDTKGPNWAGVVIFGGAHDNTIGGDTAAKGNHISGNTFQGVMIQDAGSDGNRLGGNVIGLPAVGSLDVGNGTDGVYINTGPQNTKIGNIGAGLMGNTISMNGEAGIYIKSANNNWVQENTLNSNKLHGVYVDGGAGNQILANTIAHNTTYGVYVHGTTATGNPILANSIHHNGDKGIRLFDGGNTELAAPVITAASASGASGTACASCMIHIYSDSDGQGETYHGTVNADAGGNWSYSGTLSGPNVTATNTDAGNNTSEFSAPKSITGPTPTPTPTLTLTLTPTPASCSDRIQNGGFETGDFSSWTTIGSPWIAGYLAHDGTYSGVMGGADNADDTFYQEVVLPSTAISATLTYWWYIYTQAGIGTPMDYLHVEAQDTNGTVLATLATLHDQSPTGGWFQETIDLRDYPSLFGRTIRIAFHGTTDGADFTSFYIDEVTLEVCEVSTSTPTPANTPTDTPTPANTLTDTPTPANTPTDTPTPANTPTDTPTPANTPTDTPTPSPTPGVETRIQHYSSNGELLGAFNLPGTPLDLATAANGDLLTLVQGRSSVFRYNTQGDQIGEWPLEGEPHYISVAPNGDVFVTITNNHRIVHFRSDGVRVGAFDIAVRVDDLAAGPASDIFVNINNSHRVVRYSVEGTELMEWTTSGAPMRLAVASNGDVMVNINNSHLQKRTSDSSLRQDAWTLVRYSAVGQWLGEFGLLGEPLDLALGPGGEIYVNINNSHLSAAIQNDYLIVRYDESGQIMGAWEVEGVPVAAAPGCDGSVYVSAIAPLTKKLLYMPIILSR